MSLVIALIIAAFALAYLHRRRHRVTRPGRAFAGLEHGNPIYPIGIGRTRIDVAIDYRDAAGNDTRRAITINQVSADTEGTIYLEAYCHAHKAPRTFRGDRIKCFIDGDGVVTDPRDYLAGPLKIDLWARSIRAKKPSPGWPYVQ